MANLISRRLALFRIASTSAITAAAAVPAVVVAMQPKNPENADLLRLGRHLDRLTSIMRKRADTVARTKAACVAMWPAIPAEVLVTRDNKGMCDSERECDWDDQAIWPPEPIHTPPKRYFASHNIQEELGFYLPAEPDDEPETIERRELLQRMLAAAERYDADKEHARESSGYSDAVTAHYYAGNAVQKCALQLTEIASQTPDGITIKARAYEAVAEYKCTNSMWAANQIATSLASDVCRLLSEGDEA